MDKISKQQLQKIFLSISFFVIAIFLYGINRNISLICYLFSYLIVGMPLVLSVIKNFRGFYIFDENFLTVIATIGAVYLGDYKESVAIIIFFSIGKFFEDYAINKSRKSITELMSIKPEYANIVRDSKIIKVNPEEVNIGDIIVVKSGEKIPLDGVITEGSSIVDTSSITGESMPRNVDAGDSITSGCINISGTIYIKTTSLFVDSTVSKILDLIENASMKKANIENFITKFARYYTPIVIIFAFLISIVPILFFNYGNFNDWLYRGITFIVISCPCALVISVPLSFFGGLGCASKNGILIKGSNYLEGLANAKYITLDKTGTITKGNFAITNINPIGIDKEELLYIAALVESNSNHPIAKSIVKANSRELKIDDIKNIKEYAGYGIEAVINHENKEKKIYIGNKKFMNQNNLIVDDILEFGSILYIFLDNRYVGHITIADEIKEKKKKAIKSLNLLGIYNIIMLTGDKKEIAEFVANEVNIKNIYSELSPIDKVEKIENIIAIKPQNDRLIFVGDGVNDAPVLARADVGIAMGGIGSDVAIEASDVVIMTDELSKLATAIKISKKTLTIAKENIIFALGVKFIILALGFFNLTAIWIAIFADVGVSIIAIINSLRTLNFKDN